MWKVLCLNILRYGFYLFVIIQFLRKFYIRVRAKAEVILEDIKRQEELNLFKKIIQIQKSAGHSNNTAFQHENHVSVAEICEIFSQNKGIPNDSTPSRQSDLNDERIQELLSLLSDNNDKKSRTKTVYEITKKFEANDVKQRTHMTSSPKLRKNTGELFLGHNVSPKAVVKEKSGNDNNNQGASTNFQENSTMSQPTPLTNGFQNENAQNSDVENDQESYEVVPTNKVELNNNYNHYNGLNFNKNRAATITFDQQPPNEIVYRREKCSVGKRSTSKLSPVENSQSMINDWQWNEITSNSSDQYNMFNGAVSNSRGNSRTVKTFDEIVSQERFSRRLSDYSISDLIEANGIDPDIDDIIDEIIK